MPGISDKLRPHARGKQLDITALEARLAGLGPAGLAEELRREGEALLAEAVVRSATALARDPGQLASHLAGRLGGQLRRGFFAGRAEPWLRPLNVSLEPASSPLRATLRGHTDEVRAVLVTPDGRTLLSSAEDGRVLRWDLASGELLGELVGHDATVNAMSLTPAGDVLLTASDDATIGLWDAGDWTLLARLCGHTHYVRRALASDAGRIVSGSSDGTIRVWDLATGDPLRVIEGHATAITAMALVDGGARVAAASTNNLLAVWDVETGARVSTLFDGKAGYRGEIMGLTLSSSNDSGIGHASFPNRMWLGPDGALYSAEREIVRWDLSTARQVFRGGEHGWPINDVAASGALLATASDTVRLLEHDGTARARLYGHDDHVTAVGFSPDGRTLVSGGRDRTLRVWDTDAALRAPTPPRHSGWVANLTPSPDGTRCATHTSDGVVHLWDMSSGTHLRALAHEVALLSEVCFTPDGARLVVTSSRGHLWVWDLASGTRVAAALHKEYWFQRLAPLRDGRRVLSGAVDRPLALWDLERGGEPELFERPQVHVTAMAVTPDERYVALTAYETKAPGSLQVWDIGSRTQVAKHPAADKTSFTALALADEGRLAVTGAAGGRALVLTLPDARVVHELPVANKSISRLVPLPDGRVLAGCVEGKRVGLRALDVVRGAVDREVVVELDHGGRDPELRGLSVSRDGRRAIVVADWSARLIDLETGRQVARFVGDAKVVSGIVRPDGEGALVAEEGGRVHVLALAGV